MVPGGLALFPPQAEGNARKEAASYQAGETINKPGHQATSTLAQSRIGWGGASRHEILVRLALQGFVLILKIKVSL